MSRADNSNDDYHPRRPGKGRHLDHINEEYDGIEKVDPYVAIAPKAKQMLFMFVIMLIGYFVVTLMNLLDINKPASNSIPYYIRTTHFGLCTIGCSVGIYSSYTLRHLLSPWRCRIGPILLILVSLMLIVPIFLAIDCFKILNNPYVREEIKRNEKRRAQGQASDYDEIEQI